MEIEILKRTNRNVRNESLKGKRLDETKKIYEGLKSRFLEKAMAGCFEEFCG